MKVTVFCRTKFESFHCWPDAPDEVNFLRVRHRHMFGVKAFKTVYHTDRDVEFILLKREVERTIEVFIEEEDTANWSCERWALELLKACKLTRVEVDEDGENGAIVEA